MPVRKSCCPKWKNKVYLAQDIRKNEGDTMPDVRKYMRQKRALEEKKQQAFSSSEELNYEEKLKRHHKRVIIRSAIFCGLALVICVTVSIIYRNLVYDEIEVVERIAREESMMSEYYSLDSYILRCNRDGAACVNGKGKTVWDLTFEIQRPLVDVCEDYAAIAEANGNKVYIVNKDGKQGELETLLPIRQVRVAAQGIVIVILEDGNTNWINFYNKDGDLLADNKAPLANRGYPLSLDVSNDGKKLAVSYLQIEGSKTESIMAFYNFDSVGYNVTDHLMSSTVYEDTLFPTVAFLTNTVAVAFGDNMCVGYEGNQNPEEIFKLTFEEKIESIFYDSDHIGFVFRSDSSGAAYKMKIYSKKGRLLLEQEFDQNYDKIKFIEDEIVIFGQQEILVYNINGRLKFSGSVQNTISDIMGIGKNYQYIILYQSEWEKVRLK